MQVTLFWSSERAGRLEWVACPKDGIACRQLLDATPNVARCVVGGCPVLITISPAKYLVRKTGAVTRGKTPACFAYARLRISHVNLVGGGAPMCSFAFLC